MVGENNHSWSSAEAPKNKYMQDTSWYPTLKLMNKVWKEMKQTMGYEGFFLFSYLKGGHFEQFSKLQGFH